MNGSKVLLRVSPGLPGPQGIYLKPQNNATTRPRNHAISGSEPPFVTRTVKSLGRSITGRIPTSLAHSLIQSHSEVGESPTYMIDSRDAVFGDSSVLKGFQKKNR